MEKEDAVNRLLSAMPYLRNAISDAKGKGTPMLGILSVLPDGSGKVICKFECDEFISDLENVIGASPQTEDDDAKAEALKFLQIHGIRTCED